MATSRRTADKPDMTPPAGVAKNAEKGLKLRERFGRGGTQVGVRRAHKLAERKAATPRDIRTISSYFARHVVDKGGKAKKWGDESDPSAGYIAWLLWGGDEGKRWADGLKAKLEGGA
jgi:hypothetical protein